MGFSGGPKRPCRRPESIHGKTRSAKRRRGSPGPGAGRRQAAARGGTQSLVCGSARLRRRQGAFASSRLCAGKCGTSHLAALAGLVYSFAMPIRRLPEQLVNRIAAGEVVERPASALKELVENAIDSGATRIGVSLSGGGIDRIEVADDGCGMNAGDLALALERHATSKLPGESLDEVSTLGFRGEALPSIASVARLRIESRVRGADGWARIVDNGRLESEGPAALPPGTRVTVEELFARVPARRKFLRSGRSEYGACLDAVKRLAMARPDIGFTLDHDGRRTLAVQPGEDRPMRVAALTDRERAANSPALAHQRGRGPPR